MGGEVKGREKKGERGRGGEGMERGQGGEGSPWDSVSPKYFFVTSLEKMLCLSVFMYRKVEGS